MQCEIRNQVLFSQLLHVRLPPLPVDRKTASFTFVVQPVTASVKIVMSSRCFLLRGVYIAEFDKSCTFTLLILLFFILFEVDGWTWLNTFFKKLPRTPFTPSHLWTLRQITSLISWIELAPETPQRRRRGEVGRGNILGTRDCTDNCIHVRCIMYVLSLFWFILIYDIYIYTYTLYYI